MNIPTDRLSKAVGNWSLNNVANRATTKMNTAMTRSIDEKKQSQYTYSKSKNVGNDIPIPTMNHLNVICSVRNTL